MVPTPRTEHRALQLESIEAGFKVISLPIPQPDTGSAVIRNEAANILSYHREVYNGTRNYTFPTPLVGGMSAIGRIATLGPDATSLKEGQLVYVDCVIRSRDNPDTLFLSALHDSGAADSAKLMRDVWRNGTFAEYAKFPLENCLPLNETRLCKDLGYSIPDLMYMAYLIVPFGGLRDIALQPGETIVISPATGGYRGAGVQVAIALGARVIAAGRNQEKLAVLKEHVLACSPSAQIQTIAWSGNEADDTAALSKFGTIDAVLDFTPPPASKSSHLRSATSALRRNGRVSMMGFVDRPAVPWTLVANNIKLKGKLMYECEDIVHLIKMLEAGNFARGKSFVDSKLFQLEDWQRGLDVAAEHMGMGKQAVFTP